jgi:hypothetical protein
MDTIVFSPMQYIIAAVVLVSAIAVVVIVLRGSNRRGPA